MRIVVLYLLLCLWPALMRSLEVDMERSHRQRRQLDWTGGGKIFNYDHLAMSSNNNKNDNNNKRQVVEDHSTDGPPDSPSSGLPGEPGVDYPILPSIPLTNFHCRGRVPGFYGDTQTACQVFHVCDMSGRQDSFLCPNGTIFSQKLFACDWWYNVKCAATRQHYELNSNLFKGSNLNLYGTPSFWNWLTEADEVHPKSGTTRPYTTRAPKTSHHQQQVKQTFVASPQISQQLPTAAPLISLQPFTQSAPAVLSEPTVRPREEFIPTARPLQDLDLTTAAPLEEFLPITHTTPPVFETQPEVTAEVVTQPPPVPSSGSSFMDMEGFTREYQDHYFGWITDNIHPPEPDTVPELSWADLGPNGPLMSDEVAKLQQELTAPNAASVDRRRKAKPHHQHQRNQHSEYRHEKQAAPVYKKESAPPRRPVPSPVPTLPPPVYVPKPVVPIKKTVAPAKPFVPAPAITPSYAPKPTPKTTFRPAPTLPPSLPRAPDTLFYPIPPSSPPPAPKPKTKPSSKTTANKQVTKTTTKTTTTLTTTLRPPANTDYHYYDDDVAYDDAPHRFDKPSQKSRATAAINSSQSRSDSSKRKSKHTRYDTQLETKFATVFIPSPRVTHNNFAKPFGRVAKLFEHPAVKTTPRPQPLRNSQPVPASSGSTHSRPVIGALPKRASQPTVEMPLEPRAPPVSAKPSIWSPVRPIKSNTQRASRAFSQPALTKATSSAVIVEELSPVFRPSQPIPAVTSNSNEPRIRALRAHPSPVAAPPAVSAPATSRPESPKTTLSSKSASTPKSTGGKRRRNRKTVVAYDPRLGKPYDQSHPIWKLQNWESTKL